MFGRLDDGVAVVDDADADLYVSLVFGEERQVFAVIAGAFEGDDVGIELQQIRQCTRVARHLPIDPLLIGIAPGQPAAASSRNSAFMMSQRSSTMARSSA